MTLAPRAVITALLSAVLVVGCGGAFNQRPADGLSAERAVPHEPDLRSFRMAPPPAMTRATRVRLVFRTPPLASRLAALEACLRVGGRADKPDCAPLRPRLDATGHAHLVRFGAARARYLRARVAHHSRAPAAHPLGTGLLPPAQLQASEAFAEPFFRFVSLPAVLADLSLPAVDRQAVVSAFAWFRAPLDSLCADLARAAPEVALAQAAQWARLDAFLAQLARFYGVSARLPHRLSVDLVWSPADRSRATAWAGRAVVPVNRTMFPLVSKHAQVAPGVSRTSVTAPQPRVASVGGFDRAGLARTLGVVVHEFGHTFASLLPRARRQALTDRIAGEAGVLNGRHANVLDEAVQTAAGNVLFVRSLPELTAVDRVLYAHEPGQPWPAAIDRLARYLAPVLARHLGTASGFDGPFLDAALERHVAVFGRSPVAFARVGVAVSESPAAARWWRQLLPGLSRRVLGPSDVARQKSWVRANPWLTRWFFVRTPSSSPTSNWIEQVDSPALSAAVDCVRAGASACFMARRRGGAAGWDVALAATDDDGLRRLLVRLPHRRSLGAIRLPRPVTAAAR